MRSLAVDEKLINDSENVLPLLPSGQLSQWGCKDPSLIVQDTPSGQGHLRQVSEYQRFR